MMTNTEQLSEDLHALLGEIDVGWCAYKDINSSRTHVSYGVGGCLSEQMERVLKRNHIEGHYGSRYEGMVYALGFRRISRYFDDPVSDHNALFAWNDEQRDPDVIKRRIKDAIEQIGEFTR